MAMRGDSFFCLTHTPRMAARREWSSRPRSGRGTAVWFESGPRHENATESERKWIDGQLQL
nr:MAG TPA: hypothetical protein [Caudoviricetes sp.]